ncbi:MAG TPA: hypothetical protein ENG87_00560 [Candidatus Pacearchaeota archaeon]|nr:hypothetical protein BMS3Abin17_00962 [archaeon BMS3Abin17]HDK41840.1 hypothetical protein [Candidatus Pacearchaeota archaeon]HDZ60337.1 hypothetical protein [Candidatus Pacearchaeota archaeon]
MAKKKYIWIIGILIIVGVLYFILGSNRATGFAALDNFNNEITIYNSLSCGCCGLYAEYFKKKGNSDVMVINSEDMDEIRERYGVPSRMESCHTTIIGDYFVEGHIPLEAVNKLLEEKPDIAGIAMPGMPSGSPGMPGVKRGDFVIYAVDYEGSYKEFMRI